MILTAKQQEGLRTAVARFKAGEPYTCIAGYAGTGKSTLVQFIVSALNLHPEDVAYVAFTGKAASVLRHKGCPNAMTAHKLLYYSQRKPDGKFVFKPRKTLEQNYKLIVVDEISMLSIDLWLQLLSHRIHIIACGDPFQIPPIQKNTDNHVLDKPHVFLDEIMRQAAESEIVRLSMDIRNYKPFDFSKGSEVMVIPKRYLVPGMYNWADQIITATNARRHEINKLMREAAGRSGAPTVGDKIICGHNNWDIVDTTGEAALVNGTIAYIDEIYEDTITSYPHRFVPNAVPIFNTTFTTPEGETFEDVMIDRNNIMEGKKFLTPEQEFKLHKLGLDTPVEFDYGYAITGHKSQGSQWDKVLVFEEKFPFEQEAHARWLYTACTRAAKKLVLVR